MANAIQIDVRDAIREARRANRDLNKSVVDAAIVSALNHTIAKGKTAASRQIRTVYRIKAKDLSLNLKTVRANKALMKAAIIALGRPLGLIKFNARQTQKGVTVNVMGKRKLIKGAFIATLKSGHKGVFARGEYRSGEFRFRKKRVRKSGMDLPIEEMLTTSVPTAFANDIVLQHVTNKLQTDFPKRLAHELTRRRT